MHPVKNGGTTQALRLRIAKLQKLAFGKSSERIEREIEQFELALEDLLIAVAEDDEALIDDGQDEPSPEAADAPALRRRPRVSDATPRERRELDPGACCPDCGGDPSHRAVASNSPAGGYHRRVYAQDQKEPRRRGVEWSPDRILVIGAG